MKVKPATAGKSCASGNRASRLVVVGYANRIATEVNVARCEAKGIPIYRRCSGGGTVVQGPGCLNYALVLQITPDGPLHSIATANQFIMRQNRAAIATHQLSTINSQHLVRGHTDLAIGDRKFSAIRNDAGNSSRSFHGTFLLNFDLALIGELCPLPSKQPDYREDRNHGDFLANLNISADQVKDALKRSWKALEESNSFPEASVRKLAAEKYSTAAWNRKF